MDSAGSEKYFLRLSFAQQADWSEVARGSYMRAQEIIDRVPMPPRNFNHEILQGRVTSGAAPVIDE